LHSCQKHLMPLPKSARRLGGVVGLLLHQVEVCLCGLGLLLAFRMSRSVSTWEVRSFLAPSETRSLPVLLCEYLFNGPLGPSGSTRTCEYLFNGSLGPSGTVVEVQRVRLDRELHVNTCSCSFLRHRVARCSSLVWAFVQAVHRHWVD